MTVSPNVPPLVFDDLADAVRALRESGLRLSTPRRLVLEALFEAEGPVSAVHLARKLLIDESSVYRNLEVLEHHGLIRHIHLGHSPGLYVLVGDEEVEYLFCERCAKVTAVPPSRLDSIRERIQQQLGYVARFNHFAIVGLCEECSAQPHPSSDSNEDLGLIVAPHDHHDSTNAGHTLRQSGGHDHLHSHGDYVHSHPHTHARHNEG